MTDPSENDHQSHRRTSPIDHRELASDIIWTCPMHPQIRRDHPGNCPICGMALEPLEPTAEEGPSPELTDMSRRFWVSAALTLPLAVLAFGAELLGWQPLPMQQVVQWRDSRAGTPRAADNGVLVLRTILNFARLRGDVAINVAEGVPRIYRGADRAEIIWTDEDIETFVSKAHELKQTQIADGIRLAALSGLRRQDLVTLTWDQVGATTIQKKALKSSQRKRRLVILPKLPALDELLSELKSRPRQPGVETVLVSK